MEDIDVMKKIYPLLFLGTFLCLTACGNDTGSTSISNETTTENLSVAETIEENSTEGATEETESAIQAAEPGETISTDLMEFTLNSAEPAIALGNTIGDDYFLPKEYDPDEDAKNPHVAEIGHTLIAINYTAKNLNRTYDEIDSGSNFVQVEYNNETYPCDTEYGYLTNDGENWEHHGASNVLLSAGEEATLRCCIDIPVEMEDFSDEFSLIFSIPTASEGPKLVVYTINKN